jgi:hypothetical protein
MLFRKLIQIMMLVIFTSMPLLAQDEEKKEEPKLGWENKFIGTLNLSQTALDNWPAGGDNSWNWLLNLNGSFIDKQEAFDWANTLRIQYGQSKLGSDDMRKTDDEFFFESVFTYKVWNKLNPYAAITAQTQFTEGFDYSTDPKTQISNFLDPGFFRQAIGIDYNPDKNIKTRLGLAFKQTVADEFAAIWSDDPDTEDEIETLRSEVGLESVTDFSVNVSELIVYMTKLQLFSNLNRVDEIDVNWDNLFSAKVAEYLSVTLSIVLVYDKDISLQRQLKQTLAVGLTYSFL